MNSILKFAVHSMHRHITFVNGIGEQDQLFPLSEAQTLLDACPAKDKQRLVIAMADHNNVFYTGKAQYLKAVKELVGRVSAN